MTTLSLTSDYDIFVIGDSSIDQFMPIDQAEVVQDPQGNKKICFLFDSKIPIKEFYYNPAGNATNVSIACAKLGLKTAIYTQLGDDQYYEKFIKIFNDSNVDTLYITKNSQTNTDIHSVIVYNNERTIFSYHGPKQYNFFELPHTNWIYYTSLSQNYENFQQNLINYVKTHKNIGFIYNPGSIQLKAPFETNLQVLQITDVLIVNKEEGYKILEPSPYPIQTPLDNTDSKQLHSNLQKLGPKITVITDGPKGSSAYFGNSLITCGQAIPNKPSVDKTGAGDAFSAGFIAALHYKKSLLEALKWGSINASYVISEIGSVNGHITINQMKQLIKNTEFSLSSV